MDQRGFLYRWRKVIAVICGFMWLGAFTATHIPSKSIPGEVLNLGHFILHGVGFLGLSSWFILALTGFLVKPHRRWLLVMVIMTVYAAFDEYTQQFFGRSTDLPDWIIDTVAAAVALALWEGIFWMIARLRHDGQDQDKVTPPRQ